MSARAAIRDAPGSAAAAAASTTTALDFLRLVTFRIGSRMIKHIISSTCYGFIRHGIRVTLYILVRVATAW